MDSEVHTIWNTVHVHQKINLAIIRTRMHPNESFILTLCNMPFTIMYNNSKKYIIFTFLLIPNMFHV